MELCNKRCYTLYSKDKTRFFPYSPELNPIEQFWLVVKSKVKRNKFSEKESLIARISEACDSLYMSDLKGSVTHSAKCFANASKKRGYKVESSIKWPPGDTSFFLTSIKWLPGHSLFF